MASTHICNTNRVSVHQLHTKQSSVKNNLEEFHTKDSQTLYKQAYAWKLFTYLHCSNPQKILKWASTQICHWATLCQLGTKQSFVQKFLGKSIAIPCTVLLGCSHLEHQLCLASGTHCMMDHYELDGGKTPEHLPGQMCPRQHLGTTCQGMQLLQLHLCQNSHLLRVRVHCQHHSPGDWEEHRSH